MSDWRVLRTYRGTTRVLYSGASEDDARRAYARAKTGLRDGAVALHHGTTVVETARGGYNRTRW